MKLAAINKIIAVFRLLLLLFIMYADSKISALTAEKSGMFDGMFANMDFNMPWWFYIIYYGILICTFFSIMFSVIYSFTIRHFFIRSFSKKGMRYLYIIAESVLFAIAVLYAADTFSALSRQQEPLNKLIAAIFSDTKNDMAIRQWNMAEAAALSLLAVTAVYFPVIFMKIFRRYQRRESEMYTA